MTHVPARFEMIPGEGLRTHLGHDETEFLRGMTAEMKLLLEADVPPTDPVLQRLFPDAYEEAEDSIAFRELVEDDLKAHKREALRTVAERLGKRGPLITSIPEEEISSWLTLLTDLRLALGTRLGVTEEEMSKDLDPDDPDAPAMSALHWLGWIQGTMLEALDPTLQDLDEGARHEGP
ncbi:MAG: DUF2017 family protein [Actinomycetota bacterium]